MSPGRRGRGVTGRRLAVAVLAGLAAGFGAAAPLGAEFGPAVGWLVAATVYLVWTWLAVGRMDAETTRRRATREDPTVTASHVVLLVASLASLAGVAVLLVASGKGQNVPAAALGLLSVGASWFTVHTVYTLGYAAAYYGGTPGGIDFNQRAAPAYSDFAYVGFTLGMTYQVSDTTITDTAIRGMVLRHSLLSYALGAVVIATTVNLVVALLG